jgi:PKD repeat protein
MSQHGIISVRSNPLPQLPRPAGVLKLAIALCFMSLLFNGCGSQGGGSNGTSNPPPAPTVSISANPTTITLGESTTLTWSSTNVTSCTASGDWTGTEATSGSQSITPTTVGIKTYALTCTRVGGSSSDTVTVTVNAPPTITSVGVSPSTATAEVNTSVQFSASVSGTGSFSTAVVWAVNGTAGGNATVGTIRKDDFLKAVFNWNYSAAADSIVDFRDDDPEPRRLSIDIRTAILAAIAEKRFDRVERTRGRATELLRRHSYDSATPFRNLNRDDLVGHVSNIVGTEEWFARWQNLFVKRKGDNLTQAELECVSSEDSLLGWCAANAARRGGLTSDQLRDLRVRYQASREDVPLGAERWRIMHILGSYSLGENADCLIRALTSDAYHWVRYGAARGLIEIAADAQEGLRRRVLAELTQFAQTYNPPDQLMRRQILEEILECSFIRQPSPGWKGAALHLLEAIVHRETESEHKQRLKRRFETFSVYDETA